MRATVQIASRIDARIKKTVDRLCLKTGRKLNRFVEEALASYIEELEDVEDVKSLRYESRSPLSAVIKRLKLNGKV